MSIVKAIILDIVKNPTKWVYEEFYLARSFGRGNIKVTMFCPMDCVIKVGTVSLRPGWISRLKLRRAAKLWRTHNFAGIVETLEQDSLSMDEWMKKREAEVAKKGVE